MIRRSRFIPHLTASVIRSFFSPAVRLTRDPSWFHSVEGIPGRNRRRSTPPSLDPYVSSRARPKRSVSRCTHRPQSCSFLGLPYRILNMNPKKELLWGLWVLIRSTIRVTKRRFRVERVLVHPVDTCVKKIRSRFRLLRNLPNVRLPIS